MKVFLELNLKPYIYLANRTSSSHSENDMAAQIAGQAPSMSLLPRKIENQLKVGIKAAKKTLSEAPEN